jgi:hypothetical protein
MGSSIIERAPESTMTTGSSCAIETVGLNAYGVSVSHGVSICPDGIGPSVPTKDFKVQWEIGIPLDHFEFAVHERTAEKAQNELGEEAFAAQWDEGGRLQLDDAVAHGLAAFVDAPGELAVQAAQTDLAREPCRAVDRSLPGLTAPGSRPVITIFRTGALASASNPSAAPISPPGSLGCPETNKPAARDPLSVC